MARKDYPAAERYYQQTLLWTAATLTPCAGWRIFTASSARKSRSVYRLALCQPAAQHCDIERSLQNDRLAQQAEALETRGNGRRRQHFSGNDWRWTPQCMDYLPTFAGSLAGRTTQQADTLMRNLAQQKPNDPEQVSLTGCISPVTTRTERRWRISQPAARAVEQQYSGAG